MKAWLLKELSTVGRWLIAVLVLLGLAGVLRNVMPSAKPTETVIERPPAERMVACRASLIAEAKPALDLATLDLIDDNCHTAMVREDDLEHKRIRDAAYSLQQKETPVLLWMVVAITISGVGLAVLQLVAGYKLAQHGVANAGTESNLTVEATKVSVSSSVVGILVLAISLCFFYVFTTQIYKINDATSQAVSK